MVFVAGDKAAHYSRSPLARKALVFVRRSHKSTRFSVLTGVQQVGWFEIGVGILLLPRAWPLRSAV